VPLNHYYDMHSPCVQDLGAQETSRSVNPPLQIEQFGKTPEPGSALRRSLGILAIHPDSQPLNFSGSF